MNRHRQVRARHAALILCVTTLLVPITACNNSAEKGASSASATTKPTEAPGTQSQLPVTIDGVVSSVAVTDKGVYIADTGKGNKVDTQGYSSAGGAGRLLLVEPGATAQKDVGAKVGIPLSIAAAPDGTVYILSIHPSRAVQFSSGSTDPVPLPFTFGESLSDASPSRIAVTSTGDVAVLTDKDIQLLPKGQKTPNVIGKPEYEHFLATDNKGGVYFSDGFDHDINVIESGSTEPRVFEKQDEANPTKQMVAMAFDTNGDRYSLYESCAPPQEEGLIRPCKTSSVYTLTKFANGSSTPTDIPVQGLTSATSVAVDNSGIYIADNKRVVKIAK
ncbi:MAG: serine/threonine protein kinase, bacterial [Mycobacterium sp.]|jgi:hypothetical protein|nr:serine/threonine protein kinase, bacterial [Mycobacterium sp.]